MGFSLKKLVGGAVKAVAATVAAPISAVVNVAKGGNVLQNVVSGAVGAVAASQPLVGFNTLTDGAVATTLGKAPLVGGFLSNNTQLGSDISFGGASLGDSLKYAAGQGVLAGVAYGGILAAGAFGGGAAAAEAAAATGAAIPAAGGVSAAGLAGIASAAVAAVSSNANPNAKPEASPYATPVAAGASSGSLLSVGLAVLVITALMFQKKGK